MKDIADIVREQTALYRHYDAEGKLLYVGVSLSPAARTYQHSKSAHWFRDISRIDVEWHDDREKALDAERIAIKGERPEHNICMNAVPECEKIFREWGIIPILRTVSLSEYIAAQGISSRAFAQSVGLSSAGLHGLLHGRNIPSLPVAFRIEDATGGAVPARAWVDP